MKKFLFYPNFARIRVYFFTQMNITPEEGRKMYILKRCCEQQREEAVEFSE